MVNISFCVIGKPEQEHEMKGNSHENTFTYRGFIFINYPILLYNIQMQMVWNGFYYKWFYGLSTKNVKHRCFHSTRSTEPTFRAPQAITSLIYNNNFPH